MLVVVSVLCVHSCQPDAPALARTLMYLVSVDSLHPSINHTCKSSVVKCVLYVASLPRRGQGQEQNQLHGKMGEILE